MIGFEKLRRCVHAPSGGALRWGLQRPRRSQAHLTPPPPAPPVRPQGQGGVYLAGAWCGYGFHEDGIKSAVEVVEAMGELREPWNEDWHANA